MKLKDSFHIYAFTTVFCWSLANVLTGLVTTTFSALSLSFMRSAAASAVLLVVMVASRMKPPRGRDVKWFLLSGAFGFFLFTAAYNIGCGVVPGATVSVIIATVPIMTAALARVVYGERLSLFQWAAIGLAFLGVCVLTVMRGGLSVNPELLWLIFAAVALSLYNLLQRKLTGEYSPLQISTFSIFGGTVLLAAFSPAAVSEIMLATPAQIGIVLILGIFSSALAYCSWAKAFEKAEKTSSVSNYMFLNPFLTSVLGMILLGQSPDAATVGGGIIILSALVLFNFGGRRTKRPNIRG